MTKPFNPGSGKADPTPVHISFESDDPLCPRISLGGIPGTGYYLVLRNGPGPKSNFIRILESALAALRRHQFPPAQDHPPPGEDPTLYKE